MTEPQDVQATPEPAPKPSVPIQVSRHVEAGGRSWSIVDLEDGRSWDVFSGDVAGPGRSLRLGHITISEHGFFSLDRFEAVRGPYSTLDEAAYPLGTDDPALLGDPGALPAGVEPLAGARPARAGRPWPVRGLSTAVLVAVVVLVAARAVSRRPAS